MLTCTNQSNDRSPCPFIGSKSVNQSITYSINQSNLWLIVLSNSLSCEWSLNRSVCRNQSVNHQPIDKPIPVISVNASIVDHTVNQSISQTVSQSIIINHWSLIDRFLIVWIVLTVNWRTRGNHSISQSINQSPVDRPLSSTIIPAHSSLALLSAWCLSSVGTLLCCDSLGWLTKLLPEVSAYRDSGSFVCSTSCEMVPRFLVVCIDWLWFLWCGWLIVMSLLASLLDVISFVRLTYVAVSIAVWSS